MVIADAQTAARVKTALVNDPAVGVRSIQVRVVRGTAELVGQVATAEEARRAEALARGVAGVTAVDSRLQIGADALVEPGLLPETRHAPEFDPDLAETTERPGFLAVGGSFGWSVPHATNLRDRLSISPLVKVGGGAGLGPAVGFDWYQAELQSMAGRPDVLARIKVKPVMVGATYTIVTDRASLSASLVGGYAWNSLTVTETGPAEGLPVEVSNSLAWRPGASFWYDLTRRTALNLSVGRVMTRFRLTVVEEGHLVPRRTRGDTTIFHAGLAYRVF